MDKCKSSSDGSFGDVALNSGVTVGYKYELEVLPGVQVKEDVLPALELAINDSLIASLFTDCGGGQLRALRGSRRLTINGISASPADLIQYGSKRRLYYFPL